MNSKFIKDVSYIIFWNYLNIFSKSIEYKYTPKISSDIDCSDALKILKNPQSNLKTQAKFSKYSRKGVHPGINTPKKKSTKDTVWGGFLSNFKTAVKKSHLGDSWNPKNNCWNSQLNKKRHWKQNHGFCNCSSFKHLWTLNSLSEFFRRAKKN